MNILIVSQYYYPEQFQINEIAEGLVKKGHSVTVLCGLPNYPQGRIFKGYRFGKRHETVNGVEIKRCFQFGRGKSKVGLILNYVSFALSGSLKVLFLKKKYDVAVSYQLSPVTMAYPAMLYKKLSGKKLFLYCLDIFPESVLSHTGRDGFIYRKTAGISRKIYSACNLIGVTSKPFLKYLNEVNGVDKEKMVYLPQHAGDEMLKMDLGAEDNGVADFMFAGNIGFGQNLETLVEAASLIADRDFVVHIVGDGSKLNSLKDAVREKGLEKRFVFYGRVDRSEMPDYYKKADALILTLRGDNAVGDTMPGKLQTYMTTGKPIIGAINGAAQEVILESGCGLCGPASDAGTLARNMLAFIDSPESFIGCGEKAREYFLEYFTRDKCINDWERILTECAE
ncbi:MAG: glycosyltransferase family 4 protein [Clostridiales bacterium]|nr:glycosyltransferase family 4 protein [Clostridiales bacterium]